MKKAKQPFAKATKVPVNQETRESLSKLLRLAKSKKNVETGILHLSPFQGLGIQKFDGKQTAMPLDQRTWEQFYYELEKGALPGDKLTSLHRFKKDFTQRIPENTVPICLMHFEYNAPTKAFLGIIIRSIAKKKPVPIPKNKKRALEKRKIFAGCGLLPRMHDNFSLKEFVHDGLEVNFVLNEEFFFTNQPDLPEYFKIKFDDGKGFHRLRWGDRIPVRYKTKSRKRIEVHAVFGKARVLKTSFYFKVAPKVSAPAFNEYWRLEATVGPSSQLIYGSAYVYFGTGKTLLTQPVILSEGFPGTDKIDALWDRYNQQNLLTDLMAKGYDIILVKYSYPNPNPTQEHAMEDIRWSAMLMVNCIQRALAGKVGSAQLTVGGGSMGGLITRYALTYMESEGIPHQTKSFVSFDSPQKGGYIPVSDQWFVRFFESESTEAAEGVKLFSSVAAKQMLLYYVAGYENIDSISSAKEFVEFFADLKAIGNFPSGPVKLAISDGRGDGKLQEPPKGAPFTETLEWHVPYWDPTTWALLLTLPDTTVTDPVAAAYCIAIDFWWSYRLTVGPCVSYDGAPGGTRGTNEELAGGLNGKCGNGPDLFFKYHCFIPTFSALAMDTGDPWADISKLPKTSSKFDQFYYHDTNLEHVILDPKMKTWLFAQLGL